MYNPTAEYGSLQYIVLPIAAAAAHQEVMSY